MAAVEGCKHDPGDPLSAAGPDELPEELRLWAHHQIIRTPNGEELVVLPRAEYEALIERADHEAEDAEDVAIYDARKAELAAGGVVLPAGGECCDSSRRQQAEGNS